MIVDDYEIVLRTVERVLASLMPDCQIFPTSDGLTALAQLRAQAFDLILTDYKLPGMTGLDLAQAVRQSWPNAKIFLMTGQNIMEIQSEARQRHLTLDGYLHKPFSRAQLLQLIQSS